MQSERNDSTTIFIDENALAFNAPGFEDPTLSLLRFEEDFNATSPVKRCTPFYVTVMVYSPESGYKFYVKIQRSCSPENDAIWKFQFNLDKTIDGKLVRIVEIEVGAGTDGEKAAKIEKTAKDGVNEEQFQALKEEAFPASKKLEQSADDQAKANAIIAINNVIDKA
jgi:hypothetical protein